MKSAVDATLPKLYFEKFSVANDAKFGGKEVGGVGIYLNTGDWSLTNDIAKSSPSGPSKGGQGHGPYSPDEELAFYEPMADSPNGSAAGFPIYFDTPKMVNTADGAGVQLAIGIKLGGEEKSLLDGKCTFDILGTISKGVGGRFTPAFNGVFIRKISLKGELGPVKVDGAVNFFNKDIKFGVNEADWLVFTLGATTNIKPGYTNFRLDLSQPTKVSLKDVDGRLVTGTWSVSTDNKRLILDNLNPKPTNTGGFIEYYILAEPDGSSLQLERTSESRKTGNTIDQYALIPE